MSRGIIDRALSKLADFIKTDDVTITNKISSCTIEAKKSGNTVHGTVTATSVPSGSWRTLCTISPAPLGQNTFVGANASVQSICALRIETTGEVKIYQYSGGTQHYYTVPFTYLGGVVKRLILRAFPGRGCAA